MPLTSWTWTWMGAGGGWSVWDVTYTRRARERVARGPTPPGNHRCSSSCRGCYARRLIEDLTVEPDGPWVARERGNPFAQARYNTKANGGGLRGKQPNLGLVDVLVEQAMLVASCAAGRVDRGLVF